MNPNPNPNIDPIFVKISENLETTNIEDDLTITPFYVQVGDVVNIGGRQYTVHKLRDEKGKPTLKNSDLKNNLKAYEELQRAGIVLDYEIDDLCLVNNYNGDILIEITVPPNTYQKAHYDRLTHTNQRNFFVRLDNAMLNNRLRDQKVNFEEVEIKLSPCMFASDSALAHTQSGQIVSITERNRVFMEPVVQIEVNPGFTLYEKEITSRLVGAVNLLARSQKITRVCTALPRGAYYSFLFQGAADGLVSPQILLEWFDQVDRRITLLGRIIRQGIHQYHPHLPISQYSFMDAACETMRAFVYEAFQKGVKQLDQETLFAQVMHTLREQDAFAHEVFAALEPPQNFPELADFTYAATNLTDMVPPTGSKPVSKMVIGVYDVSETLMWSIARKIRNRGLLEARGLFNPEQPQKTNMTIFLTSG
ncbi:MAG: hypothetical protein HC913_10735 [Microscillaceae bacterium]|nr:hypothetical protein [Microscillaceae bacterium]